MDTYKIDPHAHGWFQVTVTAPDGKSWVRHPFASEWAAKKWVDKRQRNQGKPPRSLSFPGQGRLMATKRIPRPRDPIQLGKLIVDIATGQVVDTVEDGKDAAAAAKGKKGGPARAKALCSRERSEIASLAATARWKKG